MTINIYDSGGGNERMEFMNNGDNEANVMPVRIVDEKQKESFSNLSKDDARALIKYFKKEFKFSVADF